MVHDQGAPVSGGGCLYHAYWARRLFSSARTILAIWAAASMESGWPNTSRHCGSSSASFSVKVIMKDVRTSGLSFSNHRI